MKFLNIVKDGIDNVVDEALYEAVYKPAGWKVVGENTLAIEKTIDAADEIVKKNTNKMKRTVTKKFDDKLIKDKGNGEI